MKQNQNLELKHRCDDFKEIRKVLKNLGATKEGINKQKDYFFDLPQAKKKQKARLKYRIEGKRNVLVYYARPDFVKGKDVTSDVALLETDVKALKFLEKSLGVIAVVEKKREIWRKDNTVFHLDEVKNVGKIFEIELQKKGKLNEKDKDLFSNYQKALLPHLGKVVKGSNINLVLAVKN